MPAQRALLLALAAALFAAACGEEQARDDGGTALLVVTETLPPKARYMEGSKAFLRVEELGGEVLVDGPVTDGYSVRGEDPLLSREVSPGEYRLLSYQRPCQGNCEFLDQPVDDCQTTVEIAAGEVLTANVVLHSTGGCSIHLSRGER